MSWQRPNIGSRVTREGHARFWERPEVKFLRATRHDSEHQSQRLPPSSRNTSIDAVHTEVTDFAVLRSIVGWVEQGRLGKYSDTNAKSSVVVPAKAGTHSSASPNFQAMAVSDKPSSVRAAEAWTPAYRRGDDWRGGKRNSCPASEVHSANSVPADGGLRSRSSPYSFLAI